MVQEVQQQGNWYQTPNEIQGIGNIRRRVKEHTQVTESHTFRCSGSGEAIAQTPGGLGPRIKGTLELDSQAGFSEFKQVGDGIRIPKAGIYQITITGTSALGDGCYHYLRIGNNILVEVYAPQSSTASATEIVNIGKYTILEYWVRLTHSSLATNQHEKCTIEIKKL